MEWRRIARERESVCECGCTMEIVSKLLREWVCCDSCRACRTRYLPRRSPTACGPRAGFQPVAYADTYRPAYVMQLVNNYWSGCTPKAPTAPERMYLPCKFPVQSLVAIPASPQKEQGSQRGCTPAAGQGQEGETAERADEGKKKI